MPLSWDHWCNPLLTNCQNSSVHSCFASAAVCQDLGEEEVAKKGKREKEGKEGKGVKAQVKVDWGLFKSFFIQKIVE